MPPSSPDATALATALHQVMREAGFNQNDMAAKLGRSATFICRLLKGTRHFRPRDITAWLDECGVFGKARRDILAMRLGCPSCGCRCDHVSLLTCCEATGGDRENRDTDMPLATDDWTPTFQRVLGDVIRRRRKARDWTRKDLRDRIGLDLSLQTLATYELGTRQISVTRLAQVALALDTTAADLLDQTWAEVFADTAGWTIDLRRATKVPGDELEPLRRWATVQLRQSPDGQRSSFWLARPALGALADLCGLSPDELVGLLPAA